MEILILGGTGAMGAPLVKSLSTYPLKHSVTVTSRSYHNNTSSVTYVKGNARDNEFLHGLLSEKHYDVIIDFMNYDLDEFRNRVNILLESTQRYIWFSSCRVYAESDSPLTESHPRLLENSADKKFLSTNRYALRKARQEDILLKSDYSNYVIIRPYITYNDERLQLGICEKEQWLNRILKNKPLVLSSAMLDRVTTLTYGNDVSKAIVALMSLPNVDGEIFQVAGNDTITWRQLLSLYMEILRNKEDISPIIYCSNSIKCIEMLYEGGYNTIYDRNYNRLFDSSKLDKVIGSKLEYTGIRDGITRCLSNFLSGERKFRHIDPIYEAYQDILTDTYSIREDFDNDEDFNIYQRYRVSIPTELKFAKSNLIRII